jgi:hypothetical protein
MRVVDSSHRPDLDAAQVDAGLALDDRPGGTISARAAKAATIITLLIAARPPRRKAPFSA